MLGSILKLELTHILPPAPAMVDFAVLVRVIVVRIGLTYDLLAAALTTTGQLANMCS